MSNTNFKMLNQRILKGPSAYAAAEIRLDELINFEVFPIHDLNHPKRQALVEQCRADLNATGCSHIPNFFLDSTVQKMRDEANRLLAFSRSADDRINPYLVADDEALPINHPKRFFQTRTSSFINSDLLEADSLLRKIYDSDVVVHFISDCLNSGPIYRWADPLGRNPYSVMKDGDYFPWHFDGNEFTVSILVQEAEEGGDFEYCPDIRTPQNENFEDVRAVLDGGRDQVKVLKLRTGDLQIFKGRYSMHRVTKTIGNTPRIIALPTYVKNPFLMNRPHHAKAFYGRHLPIHQERELDRQDCLID